MNYHLEKQGVEIKDLVEDLKDGVALCKLLGTLLGNSRACYLISGQPLKFNPAPKMPNQKVENLSVVFTSLASVGVVTRGCAPEGLLKIIFNY